MSGRREQQKAARERRILRAAEELFARRGYAGTTMEDVARRARLAVGTIYNYFPSKPEIVLSLLRRETDQTLHAGQKLVDEPARDPVQAVAALFDVYVDLVVRHDRAQLRELLAAAVAEPEAIGKAAFELDLRLLQQLAALLDGLRERGDLAAATETGRAATTLYAVYATWLMVYGASDALDADGLRREVRLGVGVAMRGMLS